MAISGAGPALVGLVVGDSIGDESDEFPHLLSWPVQNNCVAGNRIIANIEPVFSTTLANRPDNCAFCVIQGGTNDFDNSETAEDMQAAVSSMVAEAKALNLEVIVCTVTPWKNNGNWGTTEQTRQDAYNAWLAANSATLGFSVADLFDALEDPSNEDELNPLYDSGDGLHLNGTGSQAAASAIDLVLDSLGLYAEVSNVNVESWRGAVEPSESGGSGNEVQLWKGAAEPAYTPPSPPPPPPPAKGGGLTKKQRRNRQRLIVEIDNQFIEVSSQDEALELFDKARAATEEAIEKEIPIKNTKPVRVRVTSQGPEPVPLDLEKEAKKYQDILNKALAQAREKQAVLTDTQAKKAAIKIAKDEDKKLINDVRSLKNRVRDLEDLVEILLRL